MRSLLNLLASLYHTLASVLGGMFRLLAGDLHYSPPSWFSVSADAIRRYPSRALSVLGLLALMVYGVHYWKNRPQVVPPNLARVELQTPTLTDYRVTPLQYSSLVVDFSESVAPLDQVGKPAQAIQLSPKVPGEFIWRNDRSIEFRASQDWTPGARFTLSFDARKTLAQQAVVDRTEVEFTTPSFTVRRGQHEFYQDPENASIKRAVYTFDFSHPVDTKSFEAALRLNVLKEADGATPMATPKYTVSYDDYLLQAYVKTDPLEVPKRGATIEVQFSDEIRTVKGGNTFEADKDFGGTVQLPTRYSLQVNSAELAIVERESGEPERLLVVEFNQEINDDMAKKSISAKLLPAQHAERKQDQNYRWQFGDVNESTLKASAALTLEHVPGERSNAAVHQFKIALPPQRAVYLRIDDRIESFGGFLLQQADQRVLWADNFPPQLKFVGDGALLSLGGERKISVMARSTGESYLEIHRILPDQLHHFASFNQGEITNPRFYTFSEDNMAERFRLAVPASGGGKASYFGLDLGAYFNADKHGVFLLQLAEVSEGENPTTSKDRNLREVDADQPLETSFGDLRLVVLSDIGLIVKTELDRTRKVFAQSLSTGLPLANVNIAVVARNGKVLQSVSTDATGRSVLNDWEHYQREKTAVMIRAQLGSDLSFLPIDNVQRLNYTRFEIDGESTPLDAGSLRAHLFTERGLYRPGDAIHIGAIVRAHSWDTALTGVPMWLRITDPRGQLVREDTIKLDASGFFELEYSTSESSPTGNYELALYNDLEKAALASTYAQVKEFLPEKTKVKAELSANQPSGWVELKDLQAIVNAQTLFGTAANDRRVTGQLSLSPALPAFPQFPGFRFYDALKTEDYYSEALGELQSDENGVARFQLPMQNFAAGSYQLNFWTEVYEPGSGRSVSADAQTRVSSAPYLLGIKHNDDLSWITRNAERAVQVLAVNSKGEAAALEKSVQARIKQTRYVSILTKQNNGLYKYISEPRTDVIKEFAVTVAAKASTVRLPTDVAGRFELELVDDAGTVLNRLNYDVAGSANVSRSLERNAELQLSLNKPEYAPGEWIEINVRAPYSGAGLITIERERVHAHAWFKAETTASVQRIQIPDDLEAGAYVNVQFIRDPQSSEIFTSPLSYAVQPFKINLQRRQLELKVDHPELVKPGETVQFTVYTNDPAKVALFAVDEGILQVARYTLEDPLVSFFPKRSLEVDTTEILDLILPEFSRLNQASAPGGGGDEELGANLNPFKRKRETPAVFWSGLLDVQNSKTVSYTVPQTFNGRMRVMAVAVGPQKMRIFENGLVSRADFIINPSMPLMLAPGDEALVGIGVTRAPALKNEDAAARAVRISFSSKGGLELLAKEQTLQLKAGEEQQISVRVRAKDALGNAELTVLAKGEANKSASMSASTSIRPLTNYRAVQRSGNFSSARLELDQLRSLRPEYGARELSASSSPLVAAKALASFVENSGNYCSEQLASMGLAQLAVRNNPQLANNADKPSELNQAPELSKLFAVLATRQNEAGAFGLWDATPEGNAWLSSYVTLFMLEAKDRKQLDNLSSLERALNHLRGVANDERDESLEFLRTRAFAAYLLTRSGTVTTRELVSIEEALRKQTSTAWETDVTAALLASSHQLMQQADVANALLGKRLNALNETLSDEGARYQELGLFDASVDDALSAYLTLKHFPKQTLQAPAIDRLLEPLARGIHHTLSSALTIMALENYGARFADTPIKLQQTLGTESAFAVLTEGVGLLSARPELSAQRLAIAQSGGARIWYTLNESGFDRAVPANLQNQVEIRKQYLDKAGKEVSQLSLGEAVQVRVQLRSLDGKRHEQLALVDLLPAGFELQDNGSDHVGAARYGWAGYTLVVDYADFREDRVVIYTRADKDLTEFSYSIKATNVGTFALPPASVSGMYDRRVQALWNLNAKVLVNTP
jgi:alpha-2-macroglobulin